MLYFLFTSIHGKLVISFKGRHHQQDMILQCVRWYVAYSLSYRDLEELMQERGHIVQRWVVHYAPRIEKAFRKTKKRVGNRWRLDETYVRIKGKCKLEIIDQFPESGHTHCCAGSYQGRITSDEIRNPCNNPRGCSTTGR